ncbi:MAG: hypothetical protein ACYC2H_09325 [Thermoplasmatota archaeon]
MAFDFSSGELINAGGAFLFLLAGIAILAVARQARLGLRLGAFAATFGLAYVAGNLVRDDGPVSAAVLLATALAAAVCLGLLILEVLRTTSRTARRRVALLASGLCLGAGIALAVVLALAVGGALQLEGSTTGGTLAGFLQVFVIEPLLLVLLAASAQAPVGGSPAQYKGRLLVGLAAGLFAANIMMDAAAASSPDAGWLGSVEDGIGLLFGVLVGFTAWLVQRGCPPGEERFARRAFAAILVVGFLGCLQALFAEETANLGPYGIMRSIGAVLLVLAVVRYDVLGVPLPRLVVRRGALAGAALAVLFIVAQVAQSFTAKFPLLMGVLAGALVFAASQIQRAIERASSQPKASTAVAGYKAALRAAMRDGTLTRREERHLAEVAVALGISPVQALDLRDEVEREHA